MINFISNIVWAPVGMAWVLLLWSGHRWYGLGTVGMAWALLVWPGNLKALEIFLFS